MAVQIAEVEGYLAQVKDPEIPVLSVLDMGVVRAIRPFEEEGVEIDLTPTYSGCPAMSTISFDIVAELEAQGIHPVKINMVLSPAWTTDWLTEEGRKKLRAYGIAPPEGQAGRIDALFGEAPQPACPRCDSRNTKQLSQFGSTACKALYQCQDCKEPFDYFKCH
ncbi:1,2-phenylacetyl-CoA epoxidase subunit PaaD [Saprospira grandis]|uniref:Phenylacetate-CoA oxygenase, PaaJ subunit n=1 Tax=Saprospira grandis (strain Lewin) TaxID=984262 RepID=H6LB13_SAPGL|nr:1,2-phenylacetyl-CoA epoxidase subunit PaaD [Saprospira grandis]AFC26978.1 phenylacetate-CoA oxygenase, PaaJ subunit [Saprospira grandis str. Lewin]WBM76336.1 phenylacetate-CoA oxygenase subunit PaaJ [Saprospira grandis]